MRAYYVNTYATTRNYGGPEEGGWFYEGGQPVGTVAFSTEREARAHAQTIATRPARLFSNRSEAGVRVRVEGSPAAAYPVGPVRWDE